MFTHLINMPLAKKSALICALCTLTGCLILSLASYQAQRQLIDNSAELLGQNFAKKLARDASNSLVQGDKISLQSLLNDLVKSPAIVHSAVYDVANRPIAEAGAPHRSSTDRAFSASISFQDSLAGYAVININPALLRGDALSALWQLLALGLLLAALAYWAGLAPARYVVAAIEDLTTIAGRQLQPGNSSVHIAYRGRDELHRLARQILTGPKPKPQSAQPTPSPDNYALLHFEIDNLATLQQQRQQQSVQRLLEQCHRQLLTLSKLYDGELAIDNSNSFTLIFYPNSEQDYPLRALCCAYLLARQFSDTGSNNPMRVAVGLLLDRRDPSQDTLGQQLSMRYAVERGRQLSCRATSVNGKLVADNSLWQHSSVQQHVVAVELDSHSASIDALKNPYKELLDQQLTTLLSQLD